MRLGTVLERTVMGKYGRITYRLTIKSVKRYNLRIAKDGLVKVSAPRGVSLKSVDDFVIGASDFIASGQERLCQEREDRERQRIDYKKGDIVCLWGLGYEIVLKGVSKEELVAKHRQRKTEEKGRGTENSETDKDIRIQNMTAPFIKVEGRYLVFYYLKGHPLSVEEKKRLMEDFYVTQIKERVAFLRNYLLKQFRQHGYVIELDKLELRWMTSRWGSCTPGRKRVSLNIQLVKGQPEYLRAVFIHELAHFIELNHSKRFYAIVEEMEPEYWWIHREMVVFYRRTSCNAVTV